MSRPRSLNRREWWIVRPALAFMAGDRLRRDPGAPKSDVELTIEGALWRFAGQRRAAQAVLDARVER